MTLPRAIGLAGLLAVSACAALPPGGPTLLALPRDGKDYATFQREDAYCLAVAAQQTQPVPQVGSTTNLAPVAGGAAIGALGGAAAGALIGAAAGNPGAGAAIGAGTGLAAGTVVGASNATSWGLQERYDTIYAQCTTAYGNRIEAPLAPRLAAVPHYGPWYGPPYPYYGPPVASFGFGFGFGPSFGPRFGHHRGWGHRRW